MRWLLVLFAAAWIAVMIGLPPIEDETYYWTWSRAPALTYFDHPPAIAWVLAASTALLGDGVVGLRAPSLLAVAAMVLLTARTARAIEPSASSLAVLLLLGAPMFAVGYVPGTHDVLLGLACAAAAHLTLSRPGWAAFVLVTAVLIKHASGVLALGLLFGAMRARDPRLRTPGPWIGSLCGIALLLPWLAAELAGEGGSIAFQAEHVFDYRKPNGLLAIPLVIGSMLLTLGPAGGALIWPAIADALRRRDPHAPLAGGALALLLACVIAVWAGSGEANWPMPALVLSAPLVAAWIARRPRVERIARPVAMGSAVACLGLMAHAARPWIPAPPRKDPTLRGAGYDVIAAEARRLAGDGLVVTRRYQSASLLRYHLRDAMPVLELGTARRKSQYDLWPRPPLCGRFVWASPQRALPAELGATSLGEPLAIPRRRGEGGAVVETWWLHPAEAPRACASPTLLLEP